MSRPNPRSSLLDDDPDAPLVAALRSGEGVDEPFRCLAEDFAPRLERLFRGRGYSPEECEDLIQETLTRVFTTVRTFGGQCRFSSWVYVVAMSLHKNEIRARSAGMRRGTEVCLDAPRQERERGRGGPGFPTDAGAPDPLEVALGKERVAALERALARLPPRMRRCVQLRVQEYTLAEIATLMKLSVGAVKAHLHHARRRLADELAGLYEEGGS